MAGCRGSTAHRERPALLLDMSSLCCRARWVTATSLDRRLINNAAFFVIYHASYLERHSLYSGRAGAEQAADRGSFGDGNHPPHTYDMMLDLIPIVIACDYVCHARPALSSTTCLVPYFLLDRMTDLSVFYLGTCPILVIREGAVASLLGCV